MNKQDTINKIIRNMSEIRMKNFISFLAEKGCITNEEKSESFMDWVYNNIT